MSEILRGREQLSAQVVPETTSADFMQAPKLLDVAVPSIEFDLASVLKIQLCARS